VRGNRRWKTVALLACGIALGVVIMGTPAGAHVSGWAHNWKKHVKPKADKRYLPSNTNSLPRRKTITGTYYMLEPEGDTAYVGVPVSFGWKLSAVPANRVVIPEGGPSTAGCPGTVDNPKAAPGYLCAYQGDSANVSAVDWDETYRTGSGIYMLAAGPGYTFAYGTWAVTAPASSASPRASRAAGVSSPTD
jgi:hypothetical protein